jgi:hypothetical protein
VDTGLTAPLNPSVHVFLPNVPAEVGFCSTSSCDPAEREIPAHSTVYIWVTSGPYSFLYPGTPQNLAVGDTSGRVGAVIDGWIFCVAGSSNPCTYWQLMDTVRYITRLRVDPQVHVSLSSRPVWDAAALVPATGDTSVSNFAYQPDAWMTNSPGWPSF